MAFVPDKCVPHLEKFRYAIRTYSTTTEHFREMKEPQNKKQSNKKRGDNVKTKFITTKKDGAIESIDDQLSQLLIETHSDDITDEHGEVMLEKDKAKEYIDGCIGEQTDDKQFTHIIHYLKGECDNVDLALLMESDNIMKFIAKIENKHRFILNQIFKDQIGITPTIKDEHMYLLNKNGYNVLDKKMEYVLDKYDIPSDIEIINKIKTYNGLVIITKEEIPRLFEIEPGCKLFWDQITALMTDIRKETTEDSSTLHFKFPNFDTKEWHETSIPTADTGKHGLWGTIILTVAHGVLSPVHKDYKYDFEDHMTKMVNDTKKIDSIVDTSSAKRQEVESVFCAWGKESLGLKLRWTDDKDVMVKDESKLTIYIPKYSIKDNKYTVDDDEIVIVPMRVIVLFSKDQKFGYRYAKDGLSTTSYQESSGHRPWAVRIKYELIKSWHAAYIARSDTDGFGNPIDASPSTDGFYSNPKSIPNYTEQDRLIGGKSSKPRMIAPK